MAVDSEASLTSAPTTFPTWLRIWVAIQLAHLTGTLVITELSVRWGQTLFWLALAAVLAWGMWKHIKGAWVVAILFALWSMVGVVGIIFVWTEGFDRNFIWFLFGLSLGVAELVTLLSLSARAWVNEPPEATPDGERKTRLQARS